MPDFSGTPIHRKMREVQFAAGGRQSAPTFPLIDARFFETPIKWERPFIGKMREVHCPAGGRQIAPTFPLIDARFFGTPIKWERPLNRNAL